MMSALQLWSSRELITNLTRREVKVKYKRSILGWLWSLINPASTLVIYTIVFGTFLKIEPPIAGNGHTKSFALYLFAALIVWNFFSNILTGSMGAMIGSGPLIKSARFPAACPAVANALVVGIQTATEILILVVVLVIVGNVSFTILFVPLIAILLLFYALGVGLVLSIYNVYYRDVGYLVGIGLNLLFYSTPIIYTFDLVPDRIGFLPAHTLISLNPLTQFVGAIREVTYNLEVPSLGRFAGMALAAVIAMGIGWPLFTWKASYVGEEL